MEIYRPHYIPTASTWVDIICETLLPSLGLHSGLSVIAYAAARGLDRAEIKDWLWPSGQVINAWWSAIVSPMCQHKVDFSTAWDHLTRPGRTLLIGVTAWGLRLFYRIVSRSIARGRDDPRYGEAKKQPGFWNDALFLLFLLEALTQTIITCHSQRCLDTAGSTLF
jgi:steroid 5-alpha reductase family enzyme